MLSTMRMSRRARRRRWVRPIQIPVTKSDQAAEQGRRKRLGDEDVATGEHSGQHVPAEHIRAERVRQRGQASKGPPIGADHAARRNPRAGDGDDQHEGQQGVASAQVRVVMRLPQTLQPGAGLVVGR